MSLYLPTQPEEVHPFIQENGISQMSVVSSALNATKVFAKALASSWHQAMAPQNDIAPIYTDGLSFVAKTL